MILSPIRNLKSGIKRSVAPPPARFPEKRPTFFSPSLAHRMGEGGRRPGEGSGGSSGRPDPGDTVLDMFAGSNATGSAAAGFICNVKSAISNQAKRGASAFRFVDELPAEELATLWSRMHSDDLPVEVNRRQREIVLMEKPTTYAAKSKRR